MELIGKNRGDRIICAQDEFMKYAITAKRPEKKEKHITPFGKIKKIFKNKKKIRQQKENNYESSSCRNIWKYIKERRSSFIYTDKRKWNVSIYNNYGAALVKLRCRIKKEN